VPEQQRKAAVLTSESSIDIDHEHTVQDWC
jgi:hypothetical protein